MHKQGLPVLGSSTPGHGNHYVTVAIGIPALETHHPGHVPEGTRCEGAAAAGLMDTVVRDQALHVLQEIRSLHQWKEAAVR